MKISKFFVEDAVAIVKQWPLLFSVEFLLFYWTMESMTGRFSYLLFISTPPKRLLQYIRYRRWSQGILWTNTWLVRTLRRYIYPCKFSGLFTHQLPEWCMKISHSNFTLVSSCLLIIAWWSLTAEPCLQLLVICFIYVLGCFMSVCSMCAVPQKTWRGHQIPWKWSHSWWEAAM